VIELVVLLGFDQFRDLTVIVISANYPAAWEIFPQPRSIKPVRVVADGVFISWHSICSLDPHGSLPETIHRGRGA
jgi:hypothetical protein